MVAVSGGRHFRPLSSARTGTLLGPMRGKKTKNIIRLRMPATWRLLGGVVHDTRESLGAPVLGASRRQKWADE